MANFKKPPQTLVVNSFADAAILFYTVDAKGNYQLLETTDVTTEVGGFRTANTEGAVYDPTILPAGTTVVATDVKRMRITAFADFNAGSVTKVVKTKSIPGQPQIATLTLTVPTPTAGEEYVLPLYIESDNTEAEMATGANYLFTFRRPRYYQVFIAAGETATTLAVKVRDAINADKYTVPLVTLTATAAAGVVTITGKTNGLRFYLATDNLSGSGYGNAVSSGHVTQTFAVTQLAYEGRGNYQQLRTLRLQTEANIYPYSPDLIQQPTLGGAYSRYRVTQTVSRPDLGGGDGINAIPIGTFDYVIYANQADASIIAALNAWFNANATVKIDYPATTANAVIVPETAGATLT